MTRDCKLFKIVTEILAIMYVSSRYFCKGLVKPIRHFIQHIGWNIGQMLKDCWMKVYVVCTSHPTCFIQHAFILSVDAKSKMATDMLLPVILSELLDSDDEISFPSFSVSTTFFFSVSSVYFLRSACLFFFRNLQLHLLYLRILPHFVIEI